LASAGCKGARDEDWERRPAWVASQTASNKLYQRDFLTRGGDWYDFYDGWYPPENDPKAASAWRWMERRGIIRLQTKTGGATVARDMNLELFGWVPHEHVGFRSNQLEFSVNGHVLGRFDPPKAAFNYTIVVPRSLLEQSDWVDFVITATNTARPNGDWRDLGFATTGFHWTPVGGS
jgi:hypothetical protein